MQDAYWGEMSRFTSTYGGRKRSSNGHREKLGYAVEGGGLAFTSSCWIGVAPGKGLCSWIGQFFSEER